MKRLLLNFVAWAVFCVAAVNIIAEGVEFGQTGLITTKQEPLVDYFFRWFVEAASLTVWWHLVSRPRKDNETK